MLGFVPFFPGMYDGLPLAVKVFFLAAWLAYAIAVFAIIYRRMRDGYW